MTLHLTLSIGSFSFQINSRTKNTQTFSWYMWYLPSPNLCLSSHTRITWKGPNFDVCPHVQGNNHSIHIIMDDIVKGCIVAPSPMAFFGRSIKIFLDPVALLGYFVKMASVLYNICHSFLILHILLLQKTQQPRGITINFSTVNNSYRLGFMQCDERLDHS